CPGQSADGNGASLKSPSSVTVTAPTGAASAHAAAAQPKAVSRVRLIGGIEHDRAVGVSFRARTRPPPPRLGSATIRCGGEPMKRAIGAVVLMLLALGATDAGARKPEHQPRAKMTVGVLTLTQQEARRSGVLRVEIWSKRDVDVRVTGYIRGK